MISIPTKLRGVCCSWQGAGSGGSVKGRYPQGAEVIVRPNKYEKGRAHIIVLNWEHADTVSVDLSSTGLAAGQSYTIQDSQNYFSDAVVKGTFAAASAGSWATLPMKALEASAVAQINNYSTIPPHTSREFDAFILLPAPQ